MGNRAEELRKQTLAGGGATARHSMNQKTTGYIIQMREKGFDRNAEKSERRKRQEDQFVQKYIAGEKRRTMGPRQLRAYRKGLPPPRILRSFV